MYVRYVTWKNWLHCFIWYWVTELVGIWAHVHIWSPGARDLLLVSYKRSACSVTCVTETGNDCSVHQLGSKQAAADLGS